VRHAGFIALVLAGAGVLGDGSEDRSASVEPVQAATTA
jgi:hypothetical protein